MLPDAENNFKPPTPYVDFDLLRYLLPFEELLPPLAADELGELREDIRARGMLQDIVVHETDDLGVWEVLDGANRVRICKELGLEEPPKFRPVRNLTLEEKRQLALDLNLHRRHLTREQKRELVARLLVAESEKSDRAIATTVGVDHKTVAVVRAEKEAGGEIPHQKKRTGRDGKKQEKRTAKPAPLKIHRPIADTETAPAEVSEEDGVSYAIDSANDRPPGTVQGKGIRIAHEAINLLQDIPRKDPLRFRGLQLVQDWIANNESEPALAGAKRAQFDKFIAAESTEHPGDVAPSDFRLERWSDLRHLNLERLHKQVRRVAGLPVRDRTPAVLDELADNLYRFANGIRELAKSYAPKYGPAGVAS
jgi:ParB-like chromosome segregation protein Spo0J